MIRMGLLLASIACTAAAYAGDAEGPKSPRTSAVKGEPAINFSLLDYRGKYYELRRADAKVVVLYFVSLDCPIARQSVGKLEALQAEFKKQGVVFWLINSMPQGDIKDQVVEVVGRLASQGVLPSLIPRDGPDAANEIQRARALTNLNGLMPMKLALGTKDDLKQN